MIYLVIIYVIWLVIAAVIQRSIVFPRSLVNQPGLVISSPDTEVLYVDSPQGQVEGWFIPGEGVSAESPGPLVIFAHGNGELIDHWPGALTAYRRMGISVLLPEFRGYGRSAGDPGQHAITQDYVAFYDLVIQHPDVDPARVILHGRSIGGGVIAQLAAQRPSAAMILQSTPANIRRLAARFLFPWFLLRDPFDSVAVVRRYKHPVLIMHGQADHVIPPGHAKRLADAATDPASRLIWYDTDHNTVPMSDSYWQDIEAFLKDAGILQ